MKKVIGCLLIGLSFLTAAIIIAIGEISVTLKEVASGNYSWSNSFNESILYCLILQSYLQLS